VIGSVVTSSLAEELEALRSLVQRLQAENARLPRLLDLSPGEALPPGPTQLGWTHASSGPVHAGSAAGEKVRFFASLFGTRVDVYATRWENTVTGKAGWLPAIRGRWTRAPGIRIAHTCR
jgi:hypothetical protein